MVSGPGSRCWGCKGAGPENKVTVRPYLPPPEPFTGSVSHLLPEGHGQDHTQHSTQGMSWASPPGSDPGSST